MKKWIMSLLLLVSASLLHAQGDGTPDRLPAAGAAAPAVSAAAGAPTVSAAAGTSAAASATAGPATASARSEWLPEFTAVQVSAPVDIRFVQVPRTQAPRIEYDTRGAYTTRFRFEVRDKVLRITERADSRRPGRTSVTVWYNELHSASISDAAAVFENRITAPLFDLTVGGEATFEAALDVKDLLMELSGRSRATLSGSVRYLTLTLSTGSLDAQALETMSAQVHVSNSGTAELRVTDRLDARTATGGKVGYRGEPSVIRGGAKFLGGDIKPLAE